MWGRKGVTPWRRTITIRTRLVGARQAAADAKAVGRGVSGIGRSAREAERHSTRFARSQTAVGKSVGKVRSSMFGAAKNVAALGAAYVGAAGIKSSIDTTEELAKTTISLNKNLGIGVKRRASGRPSPGARVDMKALNMSFGTLVEEHRGRPKAGLRRRRSSRSSACRSETVASKRLQRAARRDGRRVQAMGPGAERTALSMKLFGRGWQTIVPLLRDGSGELKKQLALADKYGATFGGKSIKGLNDFIQAQRESKIAMMGLQITLGTTLIPVLTKALGVFSKFVYQMRTGKGAGGQFAHTASRSGRRQAGRAVVRPGGNQRRRSSHPRRPQPPLMAKTFDPEGGHTRSDIKGFDPEDRGTFTTPARSSSTPAPARRRHVLGQARPGAARRRDRRKGARPAARPAAGARRRRHRSRPPPAAPAADRLPRRRGARHRADHPARRLARPPLRRAGLPQDRADGRRVRLRRPRPRRADRHLAVGAALLGRRGARPHLGDLGAADVGRRPGV
jgi:hypothetical protein